jgi:hypothetical protein
MQGSARTSAGVTAAHQQPRIWSDFFSHWSGPNVPRSGKMEIDADPVPSRFFLDGACTMSADPLDPLVIGQSLTRSVRITTPSPSPIGDNGETGHATVTVTNRSKRRRGTRDDRHQSVITVAMNPPPRPALRCIAVIPGPSGKPPLPPRGSWGGVRVDEQGPIAVGPPAALRRQGGTARDKKAPSIPPAGWPEWPFSFL